MTQTKAKDDYTKIKFCCASCELVDWVVAQQVKQVRIQVERNMFHVEGVGDFRWCAYLVNRITKDNYTNFRFMFPNHDCLCADVTEVFQEDRDIAKDFGIDNIRIKRAHIDKRPTLSETQNTIMDTLESDL